MHKGDFYVRKWRTAAGQTAMTSIPVTRPHSAPMNSDGMKTPLETERPYVHVANKWYTMHSPTSGRKLHSSVNGNEHFNSR